jgi:predicted metal-dependent peptidase
MISEKTIRNFKRLRIKVMRDPMFVGLAPVMMVGKRELSLAVATACTNGRDEIYNPEFIFQWGDKEACFIMVHENYHKAGRHLEVYDTLHRIDPKLANAALDFWINGRIILLDPKETLVAMPRDDEGNPIGLHDPKYDGWTVKRIFDDLRKQQSENGGGGGDQSDDQDGDGDGQPDDQDGNQAGGGSGDGEGFDDHDWEGAKAMGEEEKQELKANIERAIREGAMAAKSIGQGGGGSKLGLEELLIPRVNWPEQLKEFVRATCTKKEVSTWRRLNRRFLHQDICMPTMIGNSIKELAVCPDVSGSMFFRDRYQKCMSEIEGIARQLNVDKLHLIYWDGQVERHEVYTQATLTNWRDTTMPQGGGGTDPTCVPAYLKEKGIKPDAVVMLTDGEVHQWGVWEYPVLWAITEQGTTAPVGKTIYLED